MALGGGVPLIPMIKVPSVVYLYLIVPGRFRDVLHEDFQN